MVERVDRKAGTQPLAAPRRSPTGALEASVPKAEPASAASVTKGDERRVEAGEPEPRTPTAPLAPPSTKTVARKLRDARKDDVDTAKDLMEAASAARTAEDVRAVLAAWKQKGAGDPKALLQKMLAHLEPKAGPWSPADAGLLAAVAEGYERIGHPTLAEAVRKAADPCFGADVRKQLLYGLKDNHETAEDVREALDAASNEREREAALALAKAKLGEAHAGQLDAVEEVKRAQAAYEAALAACQKHNKTLQRGLAALRGMPPEKMEAFVEKFKARHPEYAALEKAQARLAKVVTEHQDAIGAALRRREPLDEVDSGALEKAIVAVAGHPQGREAAGRILEEVVEHAQHVPEGRLKKFAESVLPEVFREQLQAQLKEKGGNAVEALRALLDSPLMAKLGKLKAIGGEVAGMLSSFKDGLTELSQYLSSPAKWREAADKVKQMAEGFKAKAMASLGAAVAGAGIVLGALAFKNADGFAERAQALLDIGQGAAATIAQAGQIFGSLKGVLANSALLNQAGGVLGAVAGVITGIQQFRGGKWVEGSASMAFAAISVLAAFNLVPGLGIVSGIITGGLLVYNAWKAHAERERQTEDLRRTFIDDMRMEPGLADFLTNSKGGSYENVREHLALTPTEIAALVKAGAPWTRQLDNFATEAFAQRFRAHLSKPKGLKATLDAIAAGFPPELRERAVAVFSNALGHVAAQRTRDEYGREVPLATRISQALRALFPTGPQTREDVEVMRLVQQALTTRLAGA